MIIDIHTQDNCYGCNYKELIDNMDQNHIDKAWLLTVETPPEEYCSAVRNENPLSFPSSINFEDKDNRFVIGYAPDPRKANSIFKFEEAISFYGVRVCGVVKFRMCYDNAQALSLFRFCGKRHIPVIVEMEYGVPDLSHTPFTDFWFGGGIDVFEHALKNCPDTIFFGHSQGFWAHISGDDQFDKVYYPKGAVLPDGKFVTLLRQYPNLYIDLSGTSALNALKRDTVFAKEFLDEFQDRTCFGRDTMTNDLQLFLNGLGLKQDILDKIYYKNALKVVPLDE